MIPYENPVEPKEIIKNVNHEITSRYLFKITTGSRKHSGTSSPVILTNLGTFLGMFTLTIIYCRYIFVYVVQKVIGLILS